MEGEEPEPSSIPSWWKGYFTQRPVLPAELPKIMRRHIVTGVMGSSYAYLLSGLFFVYFGTLVGLTPFHWGLLSGLTQWVVAAQPLSARITQKLGRRKAYWVSMTLASRMLRYLSVVASFLLWRAGRHESEWVLIIGVSTATLFGTVAEPPWFSWLADLIPEKEHGTFWGRRAAWVAGGTVVLLFAASLCADLASPEIKPAVILGVFTAGWLLGVVDVILHGSIPEPPMHVAEDRHIVHQVAQPLRDNRFRPWLIFIGCWYISMTVGGALSELYAVEDLGIKSNFLGGSVAMTGVMLLGSLVTSRWSGRLVDGLGIRRVLFVGHLGWSVLPLFWVVANPRTALVWLAISNFTGGTFSTAAGTAANKLVTRLPPPSSRTMYIAVSSTLASLMGGLGSIIAGSVVRLTGRAPVALLGLRVDPMILLFLVSALLRFACTFLLARRVSERGR